MGWRSLFELVTETSRENPVWKIILELGEREITVGRVVGWKGSWANLTFRDENVTLNGIQTRLTLQSRTGQSTNTTPYNDYVFKESVPADKRTEENPHSALHLWRAVGSPLLARTVLPEPVIGYIWRLL